MWSDKRPTKPGWYWLRSPDPDVDANIVKVLENWDGDLEVLDAWGRYESIWKPAFNNWWWCGPLKEPGLVEGRV